MTLEIPETHPEHLLVADGAQRLPDDQYEELPPAEAAKQPKDDPVSHPAHYTSHPSGVECIQITRHYDFCVGNAIKYLWRAGLKHEEGLDDHDKELEDLRKASWYIQERIRLLKGEA